MAWCGASIATNVSNYGRYGMKRKFIEQEDKMAKYLNANGFPGYASDEWPDDAGAIEALWPSVRGAHKEQHKYIILVWEDYERQNFGHPCKTLQEVLDALEDYKKTDMVNAYLVMTYARARIISDMEFDEDKYDADDNLIMPSWAA